MHNHSQHPEFNQRSNEFMSVNEKLITGIPKCLCEPLMRVAYKLLIRDYSTFEELKPQEQELWKNFKTDDTYKFLTGEPDTVLEFCFGIQLQLTSQPSTSGSQVTRNPSGASTLATHPAPQPTLSTSGPQAIEGLTRNLRQL